MPLYKVLPRTEPIGEPFSGQIWPQSEADLRLGVWARQIGRIHGARRREAVAATFDAVEGWDEGEYRFDARTGSPISLKVPFQTDVPECVFVHEVGHYLDQQHLGDGGVFASESDPLAKAVVEAARRAPSLAESIAFIEASGRRAIERAGTESAGTESAEIEHAGVEHTPMEALARDTASRARLSRLLGDREVFARVYTQYVAETMRPPVVRMQIARRMTRFSEEGAFPLFWEHKEFLPIAGLMHELLIEKGLIALRT